MIATRILAVTCLALAMTSCGGSGDANEDTKDRAFARGGTYTTALNSDPGNLHPLQAVQFTTNNVVSYAYDSLVNIDRDGEVVAQLAESWEVSPDSVTFNLRDGVTCEDGTELTAEHVAANFEWIKDPDNASSYLGTGLPSPDYEVDADDRAGTVTVTLEQPYGFLLTGAGLVPIVCPDGLAQPKRLARETDGTGPFVLTDYVADDHVTLEVRDDYRWGPAGVGSQEPGFPSKVVFRVVQNTSTAVNLFLSEELSSISLSGPDEARVQGQDLFTFETESGPLELFFNQRAGALTADPELREALTMGLDLDALTKVVTEGSGARATTLTTIRPRPCVADSTEGVLPGYDPEAAARMLEEAGWTAGPDGVRSRGGERLALTVGYNTTGVDAIKAGTELVSQQWRDLGVDVRLQGQGSNAYVETLFGGTGRWDIAFLNVMIAYPSDFVPFGSGPPAPEGQNFAAIENADYERLSERAARTPGQPGCELWAQAEQALFANLDVVPISNTVATVYARAELAEGTRSAIEPTSIRLFGE